MTTQTSETPDLEAHLDGLHRLHRGKVRDIFAVDDHHMLIVATDRVSAFDVVLPQRLPGKGKVLNSLSRFWFEDTGHVVRNHMITTDFAAMPANVRRHENLLAGRAMLVHRCVPLKAEFIVRGYLAGSGWAEYQKSGEICGHKLPAGLKEASRLPQPILTPTTKAPAGQHDENITITQLGHMIGVAEASKAGALALALYDHAAAHCAERGILLADTKLEFGILNGDIVLIDEAFTPDSSRFWSAKDWQPGTSPPSYDKQIIRDALVKTGWNKRPPAPELPHDVLERARARYFEIHRMITGKDCA